jgi:hypothetical protein
MRLLPGSMVLSNMTEDDRERLKIASDRRGFMEYMGLTKRIPRYAADRRELDELCEWLHGFRLDLIGTVTFSDVYAKAHGIYSLGRALDDVWTGLHQIRMKHDTIRGYRGRYVICGEWHPSGRRVPHVHLALDSMGVHDPEKVCTDLWRYFYGTRGRSRFEPMRDVDKATLYGLKDTVKATRNDADALRMKMGRHSALRRRP